MKTKKLTFSAVLLALGYVLHAVVPAIFLGMKPDFLLLMMFMGIMIANDFTTTISIILAAGFISASTTTFPGGQIANIVDKIISGLFLYFCYRHLYSSNNVKPFNLILLNAVATLISGSVFLFTALSISGAGLAGFMSLLYVVVLPTAFITGILAGILYKLINRVAIKSLRI
ncbi:MAG: tryptophan transporter [Firmicutes bacterium]|nr:tryptophan transporter [Bacillota bacterium]